MKGAIDSLPTSSHVSEAILESSSYWLNQHMTPDARVSSAEISLDSSHWRKNSAHADKPGLFIKSGCYFVHGILQWLVI